MGLLKQSKRANIEDVRGPNVRRNDIDPLYIEIDSKDYFPKVRLNCGKSCCFVSCMFTSWGTNLCCT